MDPIEVDGHRVVLILIRLDEHDEPLDDGHAMRTGEARWDGETLWLDWGAGQSDPPYALDPEWFPRIKPLAPGELADETGAAFSLMLGVGRLLEKEEASGEYRNLGWKWPDSEPEGGSSPPS